MKVALLSLDSQLLTHLVIHTVIMGRRKRKSSSQDENAVQNQLVADATSAFVGVQLAMLIWVIKNQACCHIDSQQRTDLIANAVNVYTIE